MQHRGHHHFDMVVLVAVIGALVMLSVATARPTSQVTTADSPASSIATSVQDCCLAQDPGKGYIYGQCLDEVLTELRSGVLPAECR